MEKALPSSEVKRKGTLRLVDTNREQRDGTYLALALASTIQRGLSRVSGRAERGALTVETPRRRVSAIGCSQTCLIEFMPGVDIFMHRLVSVCGLT